jgi:hypothetical protein
MRDAPAARMATILNMDHDTRNWGLVVIGMSAFVMAIMAIWAADF